MAEDNGTSAREPPGTAVKQANEDQSCPDRRLGRCTDNGGKQINHWRVMTYAVLRLEENDRVWVPGGGQQQTLGLDRAPRHHDLDARCVREVCLRALRVVVPAVPDRTVRRPDRQLAAVELSARAVAVPEQAKSAGEITRECPVSSLKKAKGAAGLALLR